MSAVGHASVGDSFRWLVVGGGAAGCLLARRLAESGSGSVGLVEAGEASRDARTVAPAWYPRAQGTRLDWSFRTEPQPALGGRQLAWPRGRALGGSSTINALIYLLPARGDLQRWSRLVGGRWSDALAAVAERSTASEPNPSGCRCTISGLPLEPVSETHPWCQAFLNAATSIGLQQRSPWTESEVNVCGRYWLTQQRGRRQTTAGPLVGLDAPAEPEQRDRFHNLSIIAGYQAERVVIRQGRAVAVEVRHATDGSRRTLEADEIILSAGAIGSPALLLRSGIGPAADLEACNIHCHVDAPQVGANLQDHLVLPVVFQMRSAEGLPYRFDRTARRQYRDSASGPLASNLAEVGALLGEATLPGASASEAAHTPRIQLHVTPTHYLKYPHLATTTDCMSIAITPLHPTSRGQVRLVNNAQSHHAQSHHAQPDHAQLSPGELSHGELSHGQRNHGLYIDPQYLSRASDLEDFCEGYAWVSAALRSVALSERIAGQLIPSPSRSDAGGIARTVRAMAQSIYHPVGTCRAGSDGQSVVDDRFGVRGVAGLRVADASVLPDLPSGNTMAAALLMAELAAVELLGK